MTSANERRSGDCTRADGYLDRRETRQLGEILRKVPGLVEDLLNVQTRGARLSKPGLGGRRPKKLGASIPYHLGAAEAADELHNTLAGWVRVVLEQRGGDCPSDATISLARWLERNLIALALCEGSAEALDDIRHAVITCERVVDIPPEDHVIIDEARLTAANRQVVTRDQAERLAPKLGELGEGLTARRVKYLENRGALDRVGTDSGVAFYRLGDVLHAHVTTKARSAT